MATLNIAFRERKRVDITEAAKIRSSCYTPFGAFQAIRATATSDLTAFLVIFVGNTAKTERPFPASKAALLNHTALR